MLSPRVRAIIGVVTMSALLVLYFVFAGVRAVALLASGTPLAVAFGVALLVLPLLGVWALGRELLFGYRATELTDRYFAEGGEGVEPEAAREQAEELFAAAKRAVDEAPGSWQAWVRLGLVYDALHDRKLARGAIRQAIALAKK